MKSIEWKIIAAVLMGGLLWPPPGECLAVESGAQESIAGIHFSAPVSWKKMTPTSSMRAFQYEIPSADGQSAPGELGVFYFGTGQGGDVTGNITRWKGQFTQITGEQQEEKNVQGVKVTTVSIEGTYQQSGGPMMMAIGEPQKDYALLGAIVGAPEGMVFFKLTGPKVTLDQAKPGFESFVMSIGKN